MIFLLVEKSDADNRCKISFFKYMCHKSTPHTVIVGTGDISTIRLQISLVGFYMLKSIRKSY